MIHVIVHHHVRDFSQWRDAFDRAVDVRRKRGEVSYEVYRDIDSPNIVTVVVGFNDEAHAKHSFGSGPRGPSRTSQQLLRAMIEAGVDEPPEVWFTQRVSSGGV